MIILPAGYAPSRKQGAYFISKNGPEEEEEQEDIDGAKEEEEQEVDGTEEEQEVLGAEVEDAAMVIQAFGVTSLVGLGKFLCFFVCILVLVLNLFL
jgi:hypothetical protein